MTINGQVDAQCAFQWTLSDAGTLTSEKTLNPTHNLPDTITGDSIKGTLTLKQLQGVKDEGQTQKGIRVYRDHLARDMENFGTVQSCSNGRWATPYGDIQMNITERTWNCHGSVQHAIDGTGSGNAGFPFGKVNGWTLTNLYYPFNAGASNIINGLQRGNVVLYYGNSSSFNPPYIHSATSVGGSMTWGANNSALINGVESYRFARRTIYDVIDDFYKNLPRGHDVIGVFIYKKVLNGQSP